MASFLTGPAAQLVGAGMQAIGVGIPVGETSTKLINGMRDCGIPVPPKSWFKRKNSGKENEEMLGSSRSPSVKSPKNVYDKLEEHINGVIQVVRPVIELKQMVREGCCNNKSTDRRATNNRARSESPDEEQLHVPRTSQKCSCDHRNKSSSPQKKRSSSKNFSNSDRKVNSSRFKYNSSDDDDEDVAASFTNKFYCMYCSRSEPHMLHLPCGRQVCSKCDKIENHELKSKMLRKTIRNRQSSSKNVRPTVLIPDGDDVIDLTQDSPKNIALRLPRSRAGHAAEDEVDRSEGDSVILTDDSDCMPLEKRPKTDKPTAIINLDDTVSLDDSLNNSKKSKQEPVLPTNKPGFNCPICLENLGAENVKAMTTPCGHVYCFECLKTVTSAKKKSLCALCQRPITFSKCIRLHI